MSTKIKDDELKMADSAERMNAAADSLRNMNYTEFTQGDDYKALAQRYRQNGQRAMQDTLGQLAARTGGMASSYATTAAQQANNDYMRTLEDAARSVYELQRQEKLDDFNLYGSLYDRASSAYRERVGDKQWQDSFDYQKDRDRISDDKYDAQEKEKLKAQAQSDVIAIWASGGTPTREQLIDAGWYDDTNSAVKETDGTQYTPGLSNLGQAYYKQATAEPTPEFRPVSAEDFSHYYQMFDGVVDEGLAGKIAYAIADATGNQDFADSLYGYWLYEHENPIKS